VRVARVEAGGDQLARRGVSHTAFPECLQTRLRVTGQEAEQQPCEVTVFRRLREALGDRGDIVRIIGSSMSRPSSSRPNTSTAAT
jgi:hypothetical protein